MRGFCLPTGRPFRARPRTGAFTLVEMLVATAILVIIIGILFSLIQETGAAWKNTSGKVEVFKSAQAAFDIMTRTISQATMNTYYDYATANAGGYTFIPLGNATQPTTYARNSDLQIVSGQGSTLLTGLPSYTAVTHAIFFQAPLGVTATSNYTTLSTMLNACGFYLAYGPDIARPGFLPTVARYRYRLMQFVQPSENLGIYTSGAGSGWYLTPIQTDLALPTPASDFVLAENVVALIILPKLSTKDELAAENKYGVGTIGPMPTALAPNYAYDSSTLGTGKPLKLSGGSWVATTPPLNSFNQLPPVVQVTMVAIDEVSALKLGNTTTAPTKIGQAGLFTTASSFQADLQTLENNLAAASGNTGGNKTPLNFRVFQTDVAIRGAKWTSN